MRVQAITFDFWGTLFQDAQGEERHRLRVDALTGVTGVSPEAAGMALRETMALFMRSHIVTQHTLRPLDAAQLVCEYLGVRVVHSALRTLASSFADAILEYPPVPIADALMAVRAAAERVPVAIISDTGFSPGANLRLLLERAGFHGLFTAMAFSDETGVAKPQRAMFVDTANALGVAPHTLFHLGDLEPTDIAGAHQVHGMAGLFAGVNMRYATTTRADFTLRRWREFIELLPALA